VTQPRTRSLQVALGVSLLLFSAVLFAIGSGPAVAARIVKQLRFQKLLAHVENIDCMAASGNYLLVKYGDLSGRTCGGKLRLINGVSGRGSAVTVPPFTQVDPGNSFAGFAMPRVLFDTARGYRLLNLRTQAWRAVACGTGCPAGVGFVAPSLGKRWVEFEYALPGDCGDGIHEGCGPSYANFSSVFSGRSINHLREPGDSYGGVRGDPGQAVSSNTVVNLDTANHYRRLCSPVSVSPGDYVRFFGRFVLTYATSRGDLTLRHCGDSQTTSLNMAGGLLSDFIGNDRVVLWKRPGSSRYVDGLLLPALTQFTATLPRSALLSSDGFVEMAFAGRTLYVIDRRHRLLAARLL